jgi:predicted GNAT family N-acyltransferase
MPVLDQLPLIISKKPAECSKQELEAFVSLVKLADEVNPQGLNARIMRAEKLFFLLRDQDLIGVAALKNPSSDYKSDIFKKARATTSPKSYVFELGWIVVHPSARREGHSHRLVESAIQLSDGQPVFATSRSDNQPVHKVLGKQGFILNGEEYSSTRGGYGLILLTHNVN